MKKLPIYEVIEDIKNTLEAENTLILQAPPGAGKSTVVPISLLEEEWLGDKIIIMLEPRRVAARVVAAQMARLLGEELGERVGYQVKMDSKYSNKTKILVVTEAILIRKLQSNQTLDDVALIIFDEFHERSIHTDLSLALSHQVQEILRDDLKLLIMSATLNANRLLELLGDVPVITSKGKIYEVESIYLDIKTKTPDARSLNQLLLQTISRAFQEESGDILVFLAGIKEIQKLKTALLNKSIFQDTLILPLYSSLSKKEQDKALAKADKRKIILSTNIAQTSLTIEGVSVVVDSGLEKLSGYNYANAMNHLELSFISQDSATQRAGRAGRLSHGKCYKLWHQGKILQQSTKPEILRSDLSALTLDLALWGVDDFYELAFLDIPNAHIVQETKNTLQKLHMLDTIFKITPFGKKALSLGVHPRYSYMILKANEHNFAYEACLMAALLEEKDIFKNSSQDSDIFSRFLHLYEKDFESNYIHVQRAREILKQADLLYKKLKKVTKVQSKSRQLNNEMLGALLLFAYPDRLAKQRAKNDNRYKLSNSKGAILNKEDSLFNEEYLVVANLNAQAKDSFIHLALSVSIQEIEKYFQEYIITKESISYNKDSKKFDFRQKRSFLHLELSSTPSKVDVNHDYKELLLELIKKEGLELLSWTQKAKNLQERVGFLRHNQFFEFRDLSDASLLEDVQNWLAPYMSNIKSVKDIESLDVYSMLLSLLSWEQQQELNSLAPLHVIVPSSSKISIDYSDCEKPSLSVKIQEVFGLHETPKILNNTVALQMHLLSPAMRLTQTTYDLKSFWDNSYADARKDLRDKYKRHYWPEDPYAAVATKKTKKHMMKSQKN